MIKMIKIDLKEYTNDPDKIIWSENSTKYYAGLDYYKKGAHGTYMFDGVGCIGLINDIYYKHNSFTEFRGYGDIVFEMFSEGKFTFVEAGDVHAISDDEVWCAEEIGVFPGDVILFTEGNEREGFVLRVERFGMRIAYINKEDAVGWYEHYGRVGRYLEAEEYIKTLSEYKNELIYYERRP